MKGCDVASFLAAVVSVLASRGIAALTPLASLSHGQRSWDPKFLVAVANDLERSRGANLIIAGRRQPAAVHAMVAALNHALGNVGNTVEYGAPLTTASCGSIGAASCRVRARPELDLPRALRGRDRRRLQDDHPRRPPAGVVG